MQMFRMFIEDLDKMYVSDLIDMLEGIYQKDPKARLSLEENKGWDDLGDEIVTTYDIVCYHKDERNQ